MNVKLVETILWLIVAAILILVEATAGCFFLLGRLGVFLVQNIGSCIKD